MVSRRTFLSLVAASMVRLKEMGPVLHPTKFSSDCRRWRQRFTDTFAYKDLKLTFTFSCYLIKHGDEYMVWDTGFARGTSPTRRKSASSIA